MHILVDPEKIDLSKGSRRLFWFSYNKMCSDKSAIPPLRSKKRQALRLKNSRRHATKEDVERLWSNELTKGGCYKIIPWEYFLKASVFLKEDPEFLWKICLGLVRPEEFKRYDDPGLIYDSDGFVDFEASYPNI